MNPGNREGDRLSVVIPVYNEVDVLPEFYRRMADVARGVDGRVELIFVDDGSIDGSLQILHDLSVVDPRVAVLELSRNFGKEIAMTAGLDHARGDAVVVIDADLQDPPELIPEMISHWRDGYDVVYAKRTARVGESFLKKSTAYLFYRVIGSLSRVSIPRDTGDYRLLSRRAVDAVIELREQHRFMKGLFAWIGFAQKEVPYERQIRHDGTTKWNMRSLWNFAMEGITSFTILPLKIASYIGFLTAVGAFIFGLFMILDTLLFGNPVQGYPSLMVVMLFLGGVQLMAIGVIGEYLGRMFDETKGRPLYLLKDYRPAKSIPEE
ncbi:MAG: glycosyltransferase [Haliea sp.]|nr:glycosyltransferase [Haliea sp.]